MTYVVCIDILPLVVQTEHLVHDRVLDRISQRSMVMRLWLPVAWYLMRLHLCQQVPHNV